MALVPDNTLITATPEEGRALAIMLARKTIGAIQTDADVRAGLRPMYANDPNSLTAAGHVVAIETGWLDAVRQATLWLYEFPADGFRRHDDGAGYYVAHHAVAPLSVERIDDVLAELTRRDVELRVTPSLWPLRDAVLASSLQFSFIRMANARPR